MDGRDGTEELVALLKDLHARSGSVLARAEYGRRNEALRVLADELRRLIDTSVPIDLGVVDADAAAPESADS